MPRQRDRASSIGLLPRMEARPWANSPKVTYRYHPVGGKPINLGTDREAALRKVLDLNGRSTRHGTLAWVWDQWQDSKRFKRLAAGTQADYELAWKQIEQRLGAMPVASITAPMVARYVHIDRADSPRRANIEKTLISNLAKHAIMLGVGAINPTLGVEPHENGEGPGMPETLALRAFLKWLAAQTPQRRIIGLMAEYASLAGSRRCEFLDIVWMQVDLEAGEIRTKRAKQRGRKRGEVIEVVKIAPAMRDLLARIKALGREGLYLFPNEDGNAYTDRGWKTLWQRCMTDAIKAKVIAPKQRFNFHALRHYYTTMHKATTGDLPNLHADRGVTARVYDETRIERRDSL